MGVPEIRVSLDVPLPRDVGVGAGTALFVAGTCFCPTSRISSLEIVVDGTPQPLEAQGMPRLDFFSSLHGQLDPFETASLERDHQSSDDPLLLAYRSGFWGIANIYPIAGGHAHELRLRAQLERGGGAEVRLGRVGVARPDQPPAMPRWPEGGESSSVAICMAAHNPPLELFRSQIRSIRNQTHRNWVCVISDDCSNGEAWANAQQEIAGDDRFVVSRSSRRLGFFANFERALSMAPPDAQFIALADQDDCWYPNKLETLIARLGDAHLVYSDARIVARGGQPIADTYWGRRRNNHSDLLSLLVANCVTGAASLMRREVLDYALPFPPGQFAHFHDHWIALTALSLGDIAFVDRPLYDYVQHSEASLGHATANRMTSLRERLRAKRSQRERIRMWRFHYFVDVCRLMQVAAILDLRCGHRLSARKRRVLRRFLDAGTSPMSLLVLGARGVRELVGHPETLGAEWMLMFAVLWRRLVAATGRDRPQRRMRLDAVPPPALALKPQRSAPTGAARDIADKVSPLELAVAAGVPVRLNVLIPTVDLQHFFGGYIAKLNLAARLAARGLRVRLLTVDPVGPLPPGWKRSIEAYSGLRGLFDSVEVEFGRGPSPVEVSHHDAFIATTWWTAHIAAAGLRELGGGRFVYLIQEYEPFTFPMGSYAALAAQSYQLDHFALFSTELLREYFRRHQIGVYSASAQAGAESSLAFENAITVVDPPTSSELAARTTRRLLFYARPEPHATRNMFELGLLALSRALEEGSFMRGWELRGIGAVQGQRSMTLGGGASLTLTPRSDQRAYASLLREHDVGFALMYTPHPSLVPIEMASGGMVTVTNTFENKTPAAMASISPNIIAVEASIEGLAAGLTVAAKRAEDYEARVRGSRVSWSRDWGESFDEQLLESITAVLRRE